MNERIKQLADQVWREILDETSIDGDSSNVYSPDEVVAFEQKFAELIIGECITMLEKKREYYSNPGSYEYDNYYVRMAAKEDAFDDAVSMIKSNFGVEK